MFYRFKGVMLHIINIRLTINTQIITICFLGCGILQELKSTMEFSEQLHYVRLIYETFYYYGNP